MATTTQPNDTLTSLLEEKKIYPFFQDACKAFFGLDGEIKDDHVDPYWNITPTDIYQGLYEAFEKNWQRYIPDCNIPQGESFLSYANLLHQTQCIKISQHDSPHLFPLPTLKKYPNIGLVGVMHSGKSTVADYLCQYKQYVEYSFAQPLKEGIRRLFSFHPDQVYTERKEQVDRRWGVSPRYILQQIGTNLFRKDIHLYISKLKLEESIWIENFLRWFSNHSDQNVVVSDCRFVDESWALKKCEFKLLKIIRPSLVMNTQSRSHASEMEQDRIKVDVEVVNNSTKDDLFVKIDTYIQ